MSTTQPSTLPHSSPSRTGGGNEILNALTISVIECSFNGEILFFNAQSLKLLPGIEAGQSIEDYIAFTKIEAYGAMSFHTLATRLMQESQTHRLVYVQQATPQLTWLQIEFSFLEQSIGQGNVVLQLIDAADIKRTHQTHVYKETLLRNVLRHSNEAVIVFDDMGEIEFFSPSSERVFGYQASEIIMEDIFAIFNDDSQEQAKVTLEKLATDPNCTRVIQDINCRARNGKEFPASAVWSREDNGSEPLFFLNITDITLLKTFMNSVNDAYIRTNEFGLIQTLNEKSEILFGYSHCELIGSELKDLGIFITTHDDKSNEQRIINSPSILLNECFRAADKKEQEDFHIITKHGETLSVRITIWPQQSEAGKLYNIIFRDITKKKQDEQKLFESAYTDSLTNLVNRAYFMKALDERTRKDKETEECFCLILIDLDKFKIINDTLGHDYGDELLIHVSDRLKSCVRDNDIVCRMGGDEFTIIINNVKSKKHVDVLCQRILESFRTEFKVKGRVFSTTASIGLAFYPEQASTSEKLIKAADIAMYKAKNSGKDRFVYYSEDLLSHQIRKLNIEKNLKNAIQNNEFSIVFQPKIIAPDMIVNGVEALLRWNSAELGEVGPTEFIKIAEDSGNIIEISQWVFKESIQQFNKILKTSTLAKQYLTSMSINVSALHFNSDLLKDLVITLEEEGLSPDLLEIEITETAIMSNIEASIELLREIRKLGIQISIDDFGTGHSSLKYLQQLPFDRIKIDRSFVHGIAYNEHNRFIVEAILSIVNKLQLKVIAEGVEHKDDIDLLISLGCLGFQGFYYSKPLKPEEIITYVYENATQANR